MRYKGALLAGWAGLCLVASPVQAAPHFVFGLTANQSCDVYQGASPIEQGIPSSGEGVLTFSATGGGTFQVVATGTFVDTTPPATVSNLAATSPTTSSLTLTWTAPGDDGTSGQAQVYDLRYSTSPITAQNWAGCTQVSGEPFPKPAGQNESMLISGLAAGTTYYFAIKTGDEVPNYSDLSNVASGSTVASGGDTTPPAAISNLAVSTSTVTTATLTWTATGDDGTTGKATTYDLRYSTSPINSSNYASATQVSGEPAPKTSGSPETFTVTGLTQGTTYYFALKAADEVPNWSAISNVPSTTLPTQDTTAPAAVTTLAIGSSTTSSVTLTWIATGDDGSSGKATTYDLRYSTSPISSGNFSGATQVTNEPAPKTAGQSESFTVTGLTAGTTYYFALKVADEVPNWSGISNVPSGATQNPADVTPPATVTNLAVASTTGSSATLTWTATGDDNHTGTATTYDLRYATSPIVSSTAWNNAHQVSGEPAPKPNGQAESFTVTGLNSGTTYYFALKVADEVPNWSNVSNSPSGSTPVGSDSTPPASIADLTVQSSTSSSVTLRWTAVGDDGTSGTSTRYDMRYSDAPILTDDDYGHSSYASGEPVPVPSGRTQTMTVTGLAAGHTYYFCVRAADEVSNWSGLSNSPSGATQGAADSQSPSPVNTLAVTTPTTNSLNVTWVAVGDDGSTGTASYYDLRYSLSPITSSNWTSATQVSGEPTPQASGQPESFVLSGLNPATTYYVALKVGDEVPNWSGVSNSPSGTTGSTGDVTAPAQIADLVVIERQVDRLRLRWTASGDDGQSGTAHHVEMRRSTSPITVSNWSQATIVSGVPTPSPSGVQETTWATGLLANTKYYFAIKAFDEVGNVSPMSNVPSGTTLEAPDGDPPIKINDLTFERAASDSIEVGWTAPNDTLRSNTSVAAYEVDVDTVPITDGQGASRRLTGPNPSAPGHREHFAITGLQPNTIYHIAVRSRDQAGNWSSLSNRIQASTTDGPPPPADTTPPEAIDDLAQSGVGPDYVDLHWTAPGDDGAIGTATAYDLRHATFPITTNTWDVATAVSDEASPRPAGGTESLRVEGLAVGAMHYFALKAFDEAGNGSILSNVLQVSTPRPDDVAPPFDITDLAVIDSTTTSLRLRWTTPADSLTPWAEGSGEIASYEFRVADFPINGINWESAAPVAAPDPGPAGTPGTMTVEPLEPGRQYYFAVRSLDASGNVSGLSNVVSGVTKVIPPPPPDAEAPAAVSDLVYGPDSPHSGSLGWVATGDDGVEGTAHHYLLRRIAAQQGVTLDDHDLEWEFGDSVPIGLTPKAAGEPESFALDGLDSGYSYAFGLCAVDEAGNRGAIVWSSPVVQPYPPDTLAPAAVLDLAAVLELPPDSTGGTLAQLTPGQSAADVDGHSSQPAVVLRWTAPADRSPEQPDGPVASYYLRWVDTSLEPIDWDHPLGDTAFVSTTDPGVLSSARITALAWETTYRFVLVSRDEAGNQSPLSNLIDVVVPVDPSGTGEPPDADAVAPAAISTLEGFAVGPRKIRLAWLATGDDGTTGTATRQQLRFGLSPLDESSWAGADTIPGVAAPKAAGELEQLEWDDREPATTYYVAIRVWDESGNASALSNLVMVRTLDGDTSPPAVPAEVTALFQDGRVRVVWQPSPDADLAAYQLYRHREDEIEWTLLASDLHDANYEDLGTDEGHSYTYAVAARDLAGNLSARSIEATVAVPVVPIGTPDAPHVEMNFAAFDPIDWRQDRLVLRWDSHAQDDFVGFRLFRQRDDQSARVLITPELIRGDGVQAFEERPIPEPGRYQYWIEALSVTGGSLLFDPLEILVPEAGERFYGAFPNPTPGPMQLVFSLSRAEEAELRLYDAAGRQVGRPLIRAAVAGRNEWRIDLREQAGVKTGGIYYARLVAGTLRESLRVLIVRAGR
ncbi:MAG: fibronectin type III domain-containing protein [Candidatus Eisenbacteria bacterium]